VPRAAAATEEAEAEACLIGYSADAGRSLLMTLFLASVRDAAEAELAIGAGADIIDLKDPDKGALGALAFDAIAECVRCVAHRNPVSATIGDLPLEAETIRDAALSTADLGVDYVKLGLFPGSDAELCLSRLRNDTRRLRLILVLFADALPDFDAIGLAAKIGAAGIMFDTLGKGSGALPDYIPPAGLAAFVAAAKAARLSVGLAGSLRAEHVPSLLALEPDLLGFRGALCRAGERIGPLDPLRLASIRALIPRQRCDLRKANLPEVAAQALY
jgi:(5-formylfuran-3-yl)methyl phosphate synthase